MSKSKNLVARWWNHEIARFRRHPYFWTVYTVLVCLWIFVDYGKSISLNELIEDIESTPDK